MHNLHEWIREGRRSAVSTLHAHIPPSVHRRLVDAFPHLSLVSGRIEAPSIDYSNRHIAPSIESPSLQRSSSSTHDDGRTLHCAGFLHTFLFPSLQFEQCSANARIHLHCGRTRSWRPQGGWFFFSLLIAINDCDACELLTVSLYLFSIVHKTWKASLFTIILDGCSRHPLWSLQFHGEQPWNCRMLCLIFSSNDSKFDCLVSVDILPCSRNRSFWLL